jgi:hypothetical protein
VGGLDAEERVEVGGAEIGVDEEDLTVEGGQVEPQARGHEALARAALAAADSPNPFIHRDPYLTLAPILFFITEAA